MNRPIQKFVNKLQLATAPAAKAGLSTPSTCAPSQSPPRLRVMHVTLGTRTGGMEKLLVEFAKFVDRSQFELSFSSLQTRGPIAELIAACACPVYDFHKREGVRPLTIARLAWQMRKMGTQLVHTHNTSALFYGVLAAKLAGIKRIIHTRHGQRFESTRRETRLFRWLAKQTSRIVSVSEDGRRLSLAEGVPPDRLMTILNGIDLRLFEFSGPRPFGPAIIVSRLSAEKDIASLLHAIPIVLGLLGSDAQTFSLNVVGDGAMRPQLEALSSALNLTPKVHFLGHSNNVAEMLAKASMFVLPSLTEGISLTLLEAMARGLPVVATRVGGTPEVVVDGKTGLLVSTRAPEELATAIVRLYQNHALAQRMGTLGRQRVERLFTIEHMIRAYEAQYLEVGQS